MRVFQFILPIAVFIFTLFQTPTAFAQQPPQTIPHDIFMKAQVITLKQTKTTSTALDDLRVQVLDGQEKGNIIDVNFDPSSIPDMHVQKGDTVIIAKTANVSGTSRYYFVDQYRLPLLLFVIAGFFLLIILLAGWKGVGSIAGIVISLGVIFLYIVPQIINGVDPLIVCLIGSMVILFLTTYIAHGFSKQTTVALSSTFLALIITYFLSQYIVHITLLNGYGNEEAADLHFGLKTIINLKDLLLGGIILATLGALNDITVTQAAAIFALHKTNPNFSFKQLAAHGFDIGREHAVSLINTLVLAYAGAALSLFIFFLYNPNSQPWWVILNSEFLSEELVKTIAGTAGLLLSVPIVTLFATIICNGKTTRFIADFIYAYIN